MASLIGSDRFDAIVIGGGIVGCTIAHHLGQRGERVLLLEREPDLFRRASYANQARVHNGYHYPRSLLTGLRSRVNAPRFLADFPDCIDRSFAKYYAIARRFSKVTADQFAAFSRRIGAELSDAPREVVELFDPHHVEAVFTVREYAFNAAALRDELRRRVDAAGVRMRLDAEALRVRGTRGGALVLTWLDAGVERETQAHRIFNCTYSGLNALLGRSGLPLIPLKHELTEMALVRMPAALSGIGVTVMCGPFFSAMPFPARQLHSLSHVRYTPHLSWQEGPGAVAAPYLPVAGRPGRPSNFDRMVLDSARYLPLLAQAEHVDSLWETKTVLPSSEADDSRPILYRRDHGLPNLTCILGGKVDNIYDVLDELDHPSEARLPA